MLILAYHVSTKYTHSRVIPSHVVTMSVRPVKPILPQIHIIHNILLLHLRPRVRRGEEMLNIESDVKNALAF